MTDRNFGSSDNFFVGMVENVMDPDQSGRVQVRVLGYQSNKTDVKSEDLHWAFPKQSVRSAAIGKVGESPLGVLRGTMVYGHYADADRQIPVIDGTFGKSGDPVTTNTASQNVAGQEEKIDTSKGSMPTGSKDPKDGSDPKPLNPYSKLYENRLTVTDINDPSKPLLIEKGWPDDETGIVNQTEVNKKLKEPEAPTTAAADKTSKDDVLDVVQQVDPQGISSALSSLVVSFAQVRTIMNMTSQAGADEALAKIVVMAARLSAQKIGSAKLLGTLVGLLVSTALPKTMYYSLMTAIAELTELMNANGGKIPPLTLVIPVYVNGAAKPSTIVTTVPLGYVQTFCVLNGEPYPGYVEWINPTTGSKVYVVRGSDEPQFSSPEEMAIYAAAVALSVVFITTITTLTLPAGVKTVSLSAVVALVLVEALSRATVEHQSSTTQSVLGFGVNMSNIISMAAKIIPDIIGQVNASVESHIPTSVLDQQSMSTSMQKYTKKQALLRRQREHVEKATEPEDKTDVVKDAADDWAKQKLDEIGQQNKPFEYSWPLAQGTTV